MCWRKGKASSPGADCPLSEFASACSSEPRSGSSLAASLSSHRLRSSEKIKQHRLYEGEHVHGDTTGFLTKMSAPLVILNFSYRLPVLGGFYSRTACDCLFRQQFDRLKTGSDVKGRVREWLSHCLGITNTLFRVPNA